MTREDDILERLARLEAIEAVRGVMATYFERCDALEDPEQLGALFTEDAVLRNPAVFEGRTTIVEYYEKVFANLTFSRHHGMNQTITVDGTDHATHRSYFLATLAKDGTSYIAFGSYNDTLQRADGVWRFQEKINEVVAFTPLDEGWAGALSATAPWAR